MYAGGTNDLRILPDFFISPRISLGQGTLASIDDLTSPGIRAVIVGDPGIGKTTLLQHLSLILAEKCRSNDETNPCPIFLRAHHINYGEEFSNLPKILYEQLTLEGYVDEPQDLEWIEEQLSVGKFVILIDGLDEVLHSEKRARFYSRLNDFARTFAQLPMILSSRPAALTIPFSGFTYYYIEGIAKEKIRDFALLRSQGRVEIAVQFIETIWASRSLSGLAHSPLFLTLLWQLFEVRGALPSNRASLYADCVDYLLSTWEHTKALSRNRLTIEDKQALLESLGFQMLIEDRNTLSFAELTQALRKVLPGMEIDNQIRLTEELLGSGLLVQYSPDSIGFVHRSFLEYFSARSIANDPSKTPMLIARRHLHEAVILACGLLSDIGAIIEAAVSKGEVILAAKCITQARTRNIRLANYVYKVFIDEVGQEFFDGVADFRSSPADPTSEPDQYEVLLNLWDLCFEEGLESHIKGHRFEAFAKGLFNSFSKVVRHDLHTENGELDLVCESIIATPFWRDYGGEFLVECKNWAAKVPISEVGHFAHKVEMARDVRLAFFFSVNGFTEDARRTLRNQAVKESKALIVPISGDEVKEAILRRDNLEDFFKEAIRDLKFLRKF